MYDRIIATIAAVVGLGLVVYLVVRNEPFADPNIAVMMRVVVSLAAAAFGATLPGFLNLTWTGGGLALRAGGALALFAVTYLYTPVTESAPTPPVASTACIDLLSDPNGDIEINQKCGLGPKDYQAAALTNLRFVGYQLEKLQDAKQQGLAIYLGDYADAPDPALWTTVNEQAERVHRYLLVALDTVTNYQAFMKVTLSEKPEGMTAMLYARLPLIKQLSDPVPPAADRAKVMLDELIELNGTMEVELDRIAAEIAQQSIA